MQETYYHLGVDIEQNTSLTYCLKKYIGKELLSKKDKFYCERCNCLQEAEKQVKLETLPKIFIIQLKRFQMIDYNRIKKLSSLVNIPLEINLDFLLKEKQNYQGKTKYSLRNMVIHAGSGGDYGHYISLVRYKDINWIKFNDERCDLLKEDLSKYFGNPDENYRYNSSECAYLLFYEQKIEK